jgi:hypothetical protein
MGVGFTAVTVDFEVSQGAFTAQERPGEFGKVLSDRLRTFELLLILCRTRGAVGDRLLPAALVAITGPGRAWIAVIAQCV